VRLLFILVAALLAGCTTVTVKVAIDPTTKVQSCEATYTALFNDLDAANYNVCGGSADLLGRKANAPSLIDLLKAYQTFSAAGIKP